MENKKKFYSANIPNNWTIPIVNDNQIVTIFLLIIEQSQRLLIIEYSQYSE
jgi:hypothetical protein